MINFQMYTWSCSEGVVWYLYLYGTWRYKTYRNPVYITMIKMINFKMYSWCYSAGIVSY